MAATRFLKESIQTLADTLKPQALAAPTPVYCDKVTKSLYQAATIGLELIDKYDKENSLNLASQAVRDQYAEIIMKATAHLKSLDMVHYIRESNQHWYIHYPMLIRIEDEETYQLGILLLNFLRTIANRSDAFDFIPWAIDLFIGARKEGLRIVNELQHTLHWRLNEYKLSCINSLFVCDMAEIKASTQTLENTIRRLPSSRGEEEKLFKTCENQIATIKLKITDLQKKEEAFKDFFKREEENLKKEEKKGDLPATFFYHKPGHGMARRDLPFKEVTHRMLDKATASLKDADEEISLLTKNIEALDKKLKDKKSALALPAAGVYHPPALVVTEQPEDMHKKDDDLVYRKVNVS